MKEVLLYGSIWDYTAERFINAFEQYKNEPITVRVNTNGGSPESTWGMVAKVREHTGRKLMKVDGSARSMGLFLLCYVDDSEALDVSQFLLHRAAYPAWIETSKDYMTEAMWDSLKKVNDLLRQGLEATIDVKKFEQIKGVTLDEVFDVSQRLDVNLTAQEAMEIGLVKRVVKITPEKKTELSGYMQQLAAQGITVDFPFPISADTPKPQPTTTNNNKHMTTLADLQAQHPEIYKLAIAAGVSQERDRVGSWLPFMALDAEAVTKGIKEGLAVTETQRSEFAMKAFSAQALKAAEEANAPEVETKEDTAQTAEQKAEAAINAKLDKALGIEKK